MLLELKGDHKTTDHAVSGKGGRTEEQQNAESPQLIV